MFDTWKWWWQVFLPYHLPISCDQTAMLQDIICSYWKQWHPILGWPHKINIKHILFDWNHWISLEVILMHDTLTLSHFIWKPHMMSVHGIHVIFDWQVILDNTIVKFTYLNNLYIYIYIWYFREWFWLGRLTYWSIVLKSHQHFWVLTIHYTLYDTYNLYAYMFS